MPAPIADTLAHKYPNLRVRSIGSGNSYSEIIPATGMVLPSEAEFNAKRLELAQERMWRRIQAERDRRRANGVNVGGNWFHSDDTSRIQQLGLLLMGQNMPPGIMWKTMNNTFVQMTPTLAQQIFQSTGAQDMQIFGIAEFHRAQMLASPIPSEYNFMVGWPPTFGE